MVSQKSKSKSKTKPSALRTVAVLSLAVNAVALAILITGAVLEKVGVFDHTLVNEGITITCSTEFRQRVDTEDQKAHSSTNQRRLDLAKLDFECGRNGGSQYYDQGFNAYAHSLGLNP